MKQSTQAAPTPIISNLLALRRVFVKILAGIIVFTVAMIPFMRQIFDFICKPLVSVLPEGAQMLAVGVVSPVLCPLKVTLFVAFCVSLPLTLHHIWSFIAPALYRNEKRTALPFVLSSAVMFASGMAYCYFAVFDFVFGFIASFAPESVNFAPDIDAYISFLLHMFLAFGFAFETPVAVFLLARCGIASVQSLKKFRRYVIVGAFVVAAVLTPPDVTSQLLLALPLVVLYELGIVITSLSARLRGSSSLAVTPAK